MQDDIKVSTILVMHRLKVKARYFQRYEYHSLPRGISMPPHVRPEPTKAIKIVPSVTGHTATLPGAVAWSSRPAGGSGHGHGRVEGGIRSLGAGVPSNLYRGVSAAG